MRSTRNYLTYVLFMFLLSITFSVQSENPDVEQPEVQLEAAEQYEANALLAAEEGNLSEVIANIESYIKLTGDFSFIERSSFEQFFRTPSYEALHSKYLLKFDMGTFFYLYVGLIGIFIAFMLNFRKRADKVASLLISAFVFIHSFFLIHVCLYLTNYTYYQPHTLSMSAIFSFLYGPLLYFYFKRVTENYVFKKADVLHLLPTLALIAVFTPVYLLPEAEKLNVMLGVGAYDTHPFLKPLTVIKLTSLVVYGYLTYKVYLKSRSVSSANPVKAKLQKNLMIIQTVYTASYAIYAFVILQYVFDGIVFHFQLLSMTSIVLYIGYIAYTNPQVLGNAVEAIKKVMTPKYQNSGLTPSFSLELKEELVRLLEEEKVYRQNDIKLATISDMLGTTRHNASQVINEHFDLNFFELINKYRVEEAMLLLGDENNDLNIIDVAYEVGYNNKVTFNKSFKRFANLTPSEFIKLQAVS